MSTLILVLTVIAIYHLMWECVFAPTERMALRNRLFVLRDQLRHHEAHGLAQPDQEAYWYVHDSVNSLINRVSHFTPTNMAHAQLAYRHDAQFRARIEQRRQLLEQCADPVIQRVFHQATQVAQDAMVVNVGGWYVYIVPAIGVVAALSKLKTLAGALVAAPKKDADRFLIAESM